MVNDTLFQAAGVPNVFFTHYVGNVMLIVMLSMPTVDGAVLFPP